MGRRVARARLGPATGLVPRRLPHRQPADRTGRLSAVIDFGGLGLGDPACDLTIAYTLMSPDSRAVFRAALDLDDATWVRGRGWALTTGLNAYTSYAAVNPRVAALTTRQITQALIG